MLRLFAKRFGLNGPGGRNRPQPLASEPADFFLDLEFPVPWHVVSRKPVRLQSCTAGSLTRKPITSGETTVRNSQSISCTLVQPAVPNERDPERPRARPPPLSPSFPAESDVPARVGRQK